MNIVEFIRDLAETVDSDDWEPTDSGFQLVGRSYIVKLRRVAADLQMIVESFDGRMIAEGSQKHGRDGMDDDLSNKLATLYVAVSGKEVKGSAELDDVLRDLRAPRRQSPRSSAP